jgi:cobalamin biosynthetic protein CobC
MTDQPTQSPLGFAAVQPPIADHGGGLQDVAERYGIPVEAWLDLSTGISPWPYPLPAIADEAWTRLPDRGLVEATRAAAAACYGVGNSSFVVEGAGSQAILQALPWVVARTHVAIVGFTYAEHVRCWRAAGHEITEVDSIDDVAGARVVVLANPNNPNGRVIAPVRLEPLADRLGVSGGLLIVDEAFADVAPEISMASYAGRPGLCVLRSFGKFFGLAGIRLGFALGPPPLIAALEAFLGPWRASGPALEIGRHALADHAWIAERRQLLADAAQGLDGILAGANLPVVGGTSLYRLIATKRSAALHEALARRGILVRRFQARPHWLRFGLPGDEASWVRLEQALWDAAGDAASLPAEYR